MKKENTIEEQQNVIPKNGIIAVSGNELDVELLPLSFTLISVKQ
jgi:alpha-L-arabinofuranosidase